MAPKLTTSKRTRSGLTAKRYSSPRIAALGREVVDLGVALHAVGAGVGGLHPPQGGVGVGEAGARTRQAAEPEGAQDKPRRAARSSGPTVARFARSVNRGPRKTRQEACSSSRSMSGMAMGRIRARGRAHRGGAMRPTVAVSEQRISFPLALRNDARRSHVRRRPGDLKRLHPSVPVGAGVGGSGWLRWDSRTGRLRLARGLQGSDEKRTPRVRSLPPRPSPKGGGARRGYGREVRCQPGRPARLDDGADRRQPRPLRLRPAAQPRRTTPAPATARSASAGAWRCQRSRARPTRACRGTSTPTSRTSSSSPAPKTWCRCSTARPRASVSAATVHGIALRRPRRTGRASRACSPASSAGRPSTRATATGGRSRATTSRPSTA